jgi:DNA-binding FadR family transcriptional regulator
MTISALRSNNLVEQLSQALTTQIVSGERVAGSRLPTEEKLATDYGVSRTVVREAISRLKSDGLVITKQGLGAFVASSLRNTPFRIDGDRKDSHKLVQEVFELRIGVETEAAALAAERGTALQIKAIRTALNTLNRASEIGSNGVEEDLHFHRAIARAANNALYDGFVEFLERHTREQLSISRVNCEIAGWLRDIQLEHQAIFDAIAAHDPAAARVAAHAHLRNGMTRLRRIEMGPPEGASRLPRGGTGGLAEPDPLCPGAALAKV